MNRTPPFLEKNYSDGKIITLKRKGSHTRRSTPAFARVSKPVPTETKRSAPKLSKGFNDQAGIRHLEEFKPLAMRQMDKKHSPAVLYQTTGRARKPSKTGNASTIQNARSVNLWGSAP